MKKSTRSLPARPCPQRHGASRLDPFKQSQRLPLLSGLRARAAGPCSTASEAAEFNNFYRL